MTKTIKLWQGLLITLIVAVVLVAAGLFYVSKLRDGAQQLYDGAQKLSDGSGQVADGLKSVDDGHTSLKDGLTTYTGGVATVNDGLGTLQGGLVQYTDGVSQVNNGMLQLKNSIPALSKGVKQLYNGSAQLKSGIAQYTDGVGQAYAGSVQLANGLDSLYGTMNSAQVRSKIVGLFRAYGYYDASKLSDADLGRVCGEFSASASNWSNGKASQEDYANLKNYVPYAWEALNNGDPQGQVLTYGTEYATNLGNKKAADEYSKIMNATKSYFTAYQIAVASGLEPATDTATLKAQKDLMDTLQASAEVASKLDKATLGSDSDVLAKTKEAVTNDVTTLALLAGIYNGSQQLSAGGNSLKGGLNQLNSASGALNSGAAQLSNGLKQLNSNVPTMSSGINQLYGGTSQLTANNAAMLSGLQQLKDGTQKLTDNNASLMDGVGQLSDGSGKLVDGSKQVSDGMNTLTGGIYTLLKGVGGK
ncbi:MAG TPA: hypothetical protein DCY73_05770 [Lachnospiraceae bacterium]|nr:hypothetical protein [Lachnospiraceae bacterium]